MSEAAPRVGLDRPPRVRVRLNRNTTGLIALLLAMWYAGASQGNGAAYLFGFVLMAVITVSFFHTGANLRGLKMAVSPIAPGFCGENLRVVLELSTTRRQSHYSIRVTAPQAAEPANFEQVSENCPAKGELWLKLAQRGLFTGIPTVVSSLYPLGFFTACFTAKLSQPFYVYPPPEGSRPLPRHPAPPGLRAAGAQVEGDDFAGVRSYRLGESQRHIDWKGVARGQPPMVKQWASEADAVLELTWADTDGLEHEARLGQLCRWLVLAEQQGAIYGLVLPSETFPASSGEAHFHRCLRALATFPSAQDL